MIGPIAGWRHDAFMLSVSGLQSKLATVTKEDGHLMLYTEIQHMGSQEQSWPLIVAVN